MTHPDRWWIKRAIAAAVVLAALLCITWLPGCSRTSLTVELRPEREGRSRFFPGGKRVMLVRASVEGDLRNTLPWWDDAYFTRIHQQWSKDMAGELPGALVFEPDRGRRKSYCDILAGFAQRKDELLVVSCLGDCAVEGTPDPPLFCATWIAGYRDEARSLRRESDERRVQEHFLRSTADTLRIQMKQDEDLAKLADELGDRDAALKLREAAGKRKAIEMGAVIRADMLHGNAAKDKEASEKLRNSCRLFERVRTLVMAGCSVEKFLALSGTDSITADLLRKLAAAGVIKTTRDLSPWFDSTTSRMQDPFLANCAAEATLNERGSCKFPGVSPGTYYIIIPSFRIGDTNLFVCKKVVLKGGSRHSFIGDECFYDLNDWGLLHMLFRPYLPDLVKKTATDDVTPEDLASFITHDPSSINQIDSRGMTALHYAVNKGNPGIVQLFLSESADVNRPDRRKRTPLHYTVIKAAEHSADRSYLEIAAMLLEKGAHVNARDEKSLTPLHYAAANRCNVAMIGILIKCGADVNALDDEGETPLHHAARSGSADIVSLLLKSGARMSIQNKGEETPLDLARLFSRHLVVAVLEKSGMKK